MAVTTINFDSAPELEYQVARQRVYLRERWGDEWEEIPHLYAVDVLFNAAPEIPTATFLWRYGRGLQQGETAFAIKQRLAKRRWYVWVEISVIFQGEETQYVDWYGTIEVEADHLGGVRDEIPPGEEEGEPYESGTLELIAHGLELLLTRAPINSSVYYDSANNDEIRTHRGIAFNADGLPNRTANVRGGRYIFSDDRASAAFWHTRAAVEYLLAECAIRDNHDSPVLHWTVDVNYVSQLPDWDRIAVETHGQTLFDLLNELMPRQRLMGWTLVVDPEDDSLLLRPFTFAHEDIEAAAGEKMIANQRLIKLVMERGPGEAGSIKTSSVEQFDQIIAQGRRRRICFSVSAENSTLVAGWTSADETGYEAGASGAGDYPSASEIDERRRRDADARGAAKYDEVYSRFKLPSPWDYEVGDPVAGGAADRSVIPDGDPLPYPLETYILATLPLLTNRDYSGTKIEDGAVATTGAGEATEMLPLVFFQIPEDTTRYVAGDKISAASPFNYDSNRDFSVALRVPPKSRAVKIIVIGGAQHLIATSDFTPLAHDFEPGGESWFNWESMIVTVAIEDDRHAEGRYPSDEFIGLLISGPAADALRRKVIDAGPSYKLDWVVKGTVVGTDPATSEPQQVEVDDADGVYVHDDRVALEAIARVAYAWYGTARRAITFSTHRITSALRIGDLITTFGEAFPQSINSVITQMQIQLPRVESPQGGSPGPALVEYTTAYAELDPLQLAPRRSAP